MVKKIGLTFIYFTVFVFSILFHESQTTNEYQSPIILVPGDGNSRLSAYRDNEMLNGPINFWAYTNFIQTPELLTSLAGLSYDAKNHETFSTHGYTVDVPGWGDTRTIEMLNDVSQAGATYFLPLVSHILKNPFYKRNFTVRGAPYDFRKAPNEMGPFFLELKNLVEETYRNAGNRKVVLLGHSLGCLYSKYFLDNESKDWKNKYVKTFVSVGGPYGGSVEVLLLETNGISFDKNIESFQFREMERSFPSSSFLLPNKHYFGDEVLVQTAKRNYTASQYRSFFKDIGFTDGYRMYKDVKNLIDPKETPLGLDEIYCIHGVVDGTTGSFYVEDFNNKKPIVTHGPGDGTVNLKSLEICKDWKDAKYKLFDGSNHSGVLQDPAFLSLLDEILAKKPSKRSK